MAATPEPTDGGKSSTATANATATTATNPTRTQSKQPKQFSFHNSVPSSDPDVTSASVSTGKKPSKPSVRPVVLPFKFGWRLSYQSYFLKHSQWNFIDADFDQVETIAFTFKNDSGAIVTLVPVIHVGHPMFWKQIDSICAAHDSVLMEGRYGNLQSTVTTVPPRPMYDDSRPEDFEDAEGWEPETAEGFFQPFSWGVRDSAKGTIVHAGDKYDYERLPWWASVRFNLPLLGGFDREKHCLKLIPKLSEQGYNSFCIPWGAAHMPIMAAMLMRNGFSLSATSRLVAFRRVDGMFSDGWIRRLRIQRRTANYMETVWVLFRVSLLALGFHLYILNELPWSSPASADAHWTRGNFKDYRKDHEYKLPSMK